MLIYEINIFDILFYLLMARSIIIILDFTLPASMR